MLKTHEQMMSEIIADNFQRAAVQLNAAYKKIKKFDPDNKENAVAVLWLQAKVYEMANEYQNKAEVK
jgi:hypothetical protein